MLKRSLQQHMHCDPFHDLQAGQGVTVQRVGQAACEHPLPGWLSALGHRSCPGLDLSMTGKG